jgi:hypothetical protein
VLAAVDSGNITVWRSSPARFTSQNRLRTPSVRWSGPRERANSGEIVSAPLLLHVGDVAEQQRRHHGVAQRVVAAGREQREHAGVPAGDRALDVERAEHPGVVPVGCSVSSTWPNSSGAITW